VTGLFGRKKGVDALRASELIEEGAVVVDVRERAEWDAGHIQGALHLPLGEIGQRHGQLPRDTQLIAVCRSGNRSALATESLRRAGLRVENLDGGMKAWKKAGLPMEPDDGVVA
jgi:rhodanese-related sulfurtransferase